jgi:hypothetical protein
MYPMAGVLKEAPSESGFIWNVQIYVNYMHFEYKSFVRCILKYSGFFFTSK